MSVEQGAGINGAEVSLFWLIPFISLLLSIATIPIIKPHFWHKYFWVISFVHAFSFLIPAAIYFPITDVVVQMVETILEEYLPFMGLISSLFIVCGGIRIKNVSLSGKPLENILIMILGITLASWMSTTGASLLLLRPLIRANRWRKHNAHIFVFFIFLVSNIGGALSPLGDPPLFLGFLKGVSFFWYTQNLFLPMIFVVFFVLGIFICLELYLFKYKEDYKKKFPSLLEYDKTTFEDQDFSEDLIEIKNHSLDIIDGMRNIPLLISIPLTILLCGIWESKSIIITIDHVQIPADDLIRDFILFLIGALSYVITEEETRLKNGFTWFPILEVGGLFFGIFMTIIPAIVILQAGKDGQLSSIIDAVTSNGEPVPALYFWFTGVFSSFLDNAPTYLIFFNIAGGNPDVLMNQYTITLVAISCGAVFLGAMTFIGNAPNFMVKAICEDSGIKMPSFFGFILCSFVVLVPVYALLTVVFFLN